MSNQRTGFRRAGESPGIRPDPAAPTFGEGPRLGMGGPFSQAQITHLMKTEFARARRHSYPVSCTLIRVDRLRELADSHGAELRSEIQQHLGRVVEEKTRGHDYLGSMSDGTYLLILPHTDSDRSAVAAERIRAEFERLEVVAGNSTLALTVSLGVAACEDQDTMFFDTLVSQAEVAMEQAAAQGGGRVVVFEREEFIQPEPRPDTSLRDLPPDP